MRCTVVALTVAACWPLTAVGTDARWLAALGRAVAQTGRIPHGVPYASASSAHWQNVPVLGELVVYGLQQAFGDHGLVLAQCAAAAIALWAIARETPAEGSLVLLLVPLGAADAFFVARAQLFSLALFPLLLVLLRSEARLPSARIWLLVPFLALWANLHGGVLVGLAVALAYLVVDRLWTAPATALGVAAGSVAAVLATPAGLHSVEYYHGVLDNVWRTGHTGMWAPPSPGRPLDVLFLAAALVLAAAALRGRPRPWELVALAGLSYEAATAARSEVWLVLFLAFAAARGLRSLPTPPRRARIAAAALAVSVAAAAVAIAANAPRPQPGVGPSLRQAAIAAAAGRPILAGPYDAEELALAGARVVIANPVDAFSRRDQLRWRRWLEGAPTMSAPVELVRRGSPAQLRLAHDPAFRVRAAEARALVYVRAAGTSRRGGL